jgi:RNA polymerase sigma-70 factor (sigma-E family)
VDEVVVGEASSDVVRDDNDRTPDPVDAAAEFDAFVAQVGGRLLATAYLLTGDHRAAEDLVQDTLLRAWSHWPRVRRADQPLAYVRRMLVTTSVSRWRSARTRLTSERLVETPPEQPTNDVTPRDDALWRTVVALPPRQRAVLVLSYYEDLADSDIADVLACTVGTVKSQRAKALRALRARMSKEDQ